jgi:hypothetical protein
MAGVCLRFKRIYSIHFQERRTIFYLEERGKMLVRLIEKYLPDHTVLYPDEITNQEKYIL